MFKLPFFNRKRVPAVNSRWRLRTKRYLVMVTVTKVGRGFVYYNYDSGGDNAREIGEFYEMFKEAQ